MGVYNGGRRDDTIRAKNTDDFINGKDGADKLYGNGGNDRIYGGNGNDLLDGGDGHDVLQGEAGNDTLLGGAGVDLLNGGYGNDILNGGAEGDSIHGYLGADDLDGGVGADFFAYTGAAESNAAGGIDLIRNFDPAEDMLEFGGSMDWIDSNPTVNGMQPFQYVGAVRLQNELATDNGQATLSYADGITTLTLYRYGSADPYMTFSFVGEYDPGDIHAIVNGLPVQPYEAIIY